jgi:uncharacterized cupredoxin-like copper-binding protein
MSPLLIDSAGTSPEHTRPTIAETAEADGRAWVYVGIGLVGLVALIAVLVSVVALATGGEARTVVAAPAAAQADQAGTDPAAAPSAAEAKGVAFEKFERVDPTLPPVPAGAVKTFKVDVFQHVTQVSKDLAPTEVWSYAVNGTYHRGTGVSAPMVVNEGDTVDFTLVNGTDEAMKVDVPHSLDFHSAEVNPGTRYRDLAPGKSMHYRFVAEHPGVFMYHCATQPVLMHTGAGMVGMFVVKPKNLARVDKELWITQQEYYLGEPGGDADMTKMAAKAPDVIAFNGYANQYQDQPIPVKVDETVRLYVLNAGPSVWSAFHVIGTVFDRTVVEGTAGHDAQTINLAPSQGGWVEFTLDEEGAYPFVNHAFADMTKGSLGILKTPHAPEAGGGHDMSGHGSAAASEGAASGAADVNVKLGEMYIEADKTEVEAGKVSFSIANEGSTTHGMAMAVQPVQADGGMLDDAALLNKGKELAGGESETVSFDLEPGSYELVCFVPGHYAAGQKLAFEVK